MAPYVSETALFSVVGEETHRQKSTTLSTNTKAFNEAKVSTGKNPKNILATTKDSAWVKKAVIHFRRNRQEANFIDLGEKQLARLKGAKRWVRGGTGGCTLAIYRIREIIRPQTKNIIALMNLIAATNIR